MKEHTRISFSAILCLIINAIQVRGEAASPTPSASNTVVARVLEVISLDDNKWMLAVKTARGWDIKIKQYISNIETAKDIYVHMYTRNSPNSFQESLYQSSLCDLLSNYPDSLFFPRDIVYMILPAVAHSCEIKKGKVQMQSSRCLSTDIRQNPGILFPRSNSYELLVDFLSKTLPDNQRFFRVYLTVGNKTDCTYGQSIDNKGNGNSRNKCSNALKLLRPLCKIQQKITSDISVIGKNIGHLL